MTEILIPQYRESDLYYWDKKQYLKHKAFFEKGLFHFEGEFAGQPFKLNSWQDEVIARFYGTLQKKDGLRRYRDVAIWIPKGGGKTEFAAGWALDGVCNDNEPSAEGYVAAKSRDQADTCYTKAQRFVANSPLLRDRFIESYGQLVYTQKIKQNDQEQNDICVFGAISSEGRNFHGKSPHIAILDELFNQTDSTLYNALSSSRRSRRQGALITISTAGERCNEFAYQQYQYAKSILRDPDKNPAYLALIYEAYESDDWMDEKIWAKANPSLGITPKLDHFKNEFLKAKESPTLAKDFKQFRLNLWVSSTSAWLNQEKWNACKAPICLEALKGLPCVAGLDISSTTDLSALVLAFKKDDEYLIVPYFFMPRETIRERSYDDRADYFEWMQKGYIIPCEGANIDQDVIVNQVLELKKDFDIRQLIVDPWKAAYITQRLEPELPMIYTFKQDLRTYTQPCAFFESLILDGKLQHDNPILDWMAQHVEVYRDNNDNMRPVKPEGSRGRNMRIDGIVASIMALAAYMKGAQQEKKKSVYEEEGRLYKFFDW
jgi:phage terminase large subunit-like protein